MQLSIGYWLALEATWHSGYQLIHPVCQFAYLGTVHASTHMPDLAFGSSQIRLAIN